MEVSFPKSKIVKSPDNSKIIRVQTSRISNISIFIEFRSKIPLAHYLLVPHGTCMQNIKKSYLAVCEIWMKMEQQQTIAANNNQRSDIELAKQLKTDIFI